MPFFPFFFCFSSADHLAIFYMTECSGLESLDVGLNLRFEFLVSGHFHLLAFIEVHSCKQVANAFPSTKYNSSILLQVSLEC